MEKKCYKTAQIELFKKLFGIFPSAEAKKFFEEKLKKAAKLIKKEKKEE